MAKGSRSNRQKALRTLRRHHTSEWQEEADRKRLETLSSCANAEPIPVESTPAPEAAEPMRTSKPAVDSTSAMETDAPKASKKRKGLAVKGGVGKKRQKQTGVLDKWALENPEKRKRNRGKKRS